MENSKNILNYWPMKQFDPRQSQKIALDWIENLGPDIRYILLEIPVGGGKSPIALNMSGYLADSLGNAYILTPQKILQKQYEDSFDKELIHSLYGKANYTCSSKNTNCDIGSDIKPQCPSCPYRDAFVKCRKEPNIVLNYTLGLNLFKYVQDSEMIKKRKLIVFDEAHTLENHLVEFNLININEFKCKKIGDITFKNFTSFKDAYNWVEKEYVAALIPKVRKMSSAVKEMMDEYEHSGTSPTGEELKFISTYKELRDHLNVIQQDLLLLGYEEASERFVFIREHDKSFKFKELYGKHIFADIVEPMADRFLFMSSTILDKNEFCRDLGLDPDKTAFLSLDSEFHVDNRQVVYMPTAKMNYGWDSKERKPERDKMAEIIKEICQIHKDDSGIIHAGNFKISDWLTNELDGNIPHQVLEHGQNSGRKRDEVINSYSENDGISKLLISPSITEGLDLKDDKGRFAIFCKIPFPNIGDAWIKKRMDISPNWYMRQTLIAIIQGCGRVVRSQDDWGMVYILDASFISLYNRGKFMIPQWWKDGLKK